MKQISIALNVVLISVLVFIACSKKSQPTVSSKQTRISQLKLAPNQQCSLCKTYERSELQGINAETAKGMSQTYRKENQLRMKDNTRDARSAWFSLESMKAFIYLIEKASCDSGCSQNLKLGIRVYYAKYPPERDFPESLSKAIPGSYAEHHTLFMVPTYRREDSMDINYDFDPWHIGGTPCKPKTFNSLFNQNFPFSDSNRSLILSIDTRQLTSDDGTVVGFLDPMAPLIKNHGGLIPPDPPEGTAF